MRIDPRAPSSHEVTPDADRAAGRGERTNRVWPWLVAAALSVGNLFLHKPISDVCDALYARMGRGAYEWSTLLAIGALSAVGAGWLVGRQRARALLQPPVIACLLVLAAATVAAQRYLLVSNIELIHFPQFGPIAAPLATGLGPHGAWIGATLAGVLDETYQDPSSRPAAYAARLQRYRLNAIGAARS